MWDAPSAPANSPQGRLRGSYVEFSSRRRRGRSGLDRPDEQDWGAAAGQGAAGAAAIAKKQFTGNMRLSQRDSF
jgi:hypothetical protein